MNPPNTISEMNRPAKLLVSRREAAAELGLSTRSIDWLIQTGKLPSVRFGRRVCIPTDKLLQFAQTGHSERIRPKQ